MNPTSADELLLLRESGELDPARLAELEKSLADDPALRARAEEFARIQRAARAASALTVPPLNDVARERILRAAARPPRATLPRLLAAAAGLALAFGLWSHLRPPVDPMPTESLSLVPEAPSSIASDLLADGEEFPEIETLAEQLLFLATLDLRRDLTNGDPEVWAEELLALEDSI